MGPTIGASVELGVAQGFVRKLQCGRVAIMRCLPLKHGGHKRPLRSYACRVEFLNALPFAFVENGKIAGGPVPDLRYRVHQCSEMCCHPLYAPWVEEIAVIEPIKIDSAIALERMEFKIEPNAQLSRRHGYNFQPAQLCFAHRSVLKREHYLEQRRGVQAPFHP